MMRTRSQTSHEASQASETNPPTLSARTAARNKASVVAPPATVAAAGSDAINAAEAIPEAEAAANARKPRAKKVKRAVIVAAAPNLEIDPVVGIAPVPAALPAENVATFACPHACGKRFVNEAKLRKHNNAVHAPGKAIIPDLSYVNKLGLTQCRHCLRLYKLVAGAVASHDSCREKLQQDRRAAEDPLKEERRKRVAQERVLRRALAGKAPALSASDAEAASRAIAGWTAHQKHSTPVWFAVVRTILERFTAALERGPDGEDDAETAMMMFLLTSKDVEEWDRGDGFQHVGDGTGVEVPPDDSFPAAPPRDAAADAVKQLTKAGSLFAEGLARRALKVLQRKPLLEMTAAVYGMAKGLLGMEPRERPARVIAGSDDEQAAAAAAGQARGDAEEDDMRSAIGVDTNSTRCYSTHCPY